MKVNHSMDENQVHSSKKIFVSKVVTIEQDVPKELILKKLLKLETEQNEVKEIVQTLMTQVKTLSNLKAE